MCRSERAAQRASGRPARRAPGQPPPPPRRRISRTPPQKNAKSPSSASATSTGAGAEPRRTSASATFVSPPSGAMGNSRYSRSSLTGSGVLARGSASHPSSGSGENSGARDRLVQLSPMKARCINTVWAGVGPGAFHHRVDKEKVEGHLSRSVEALQLAKTDVGITKAANRHLRQQVDAKQAEIDHLQRPPQFAARVGGEPERERGCRERPSAP